MNTTPARYARIGTPCYAADGTLWVRLGNGIDDFEWAMFVTDYDEGERYTTFARDCAPGMDEELTEVPAPPK